ncbi:unnamed protein product [Chrysodeixis includens]|uniref:Uncharacterized protein n=1 Tax=Chrysodeixis includens TaxID=689277 RepID=A0A9P0FPB3_CHRIL|nr:unnamed protein product [Chrysodeixis includens]
MDPCQRYTYHTSVHLLSTLAPALDITTDGAGTQLPNHADVECIQGVAAIRITSRLRKNVWLRVFLNQITRCNGSTSTLLVYRLLLATCSRRLQISNFA